MKLFSIPWLRSSPYENWGLYEIALTTMRNRCGVVAAIAPLYSARMRCIAQQIHRDRPRILEEGAVVDYLENEILRTEFSLIEDTLDGLQDLGAYA